jgi:hypothetical protein
MRKVVLMTDSIEISDDDAQRAMQALSDKLHVPTLKIIEIYKTEYRRIAAQSRITKFVSVLAMRNTRALLTNPGLSN